jgi:hypothetical protein
MIPTVVHEKPKPRLSATRTAETDEAVCWVMGGF